MQIRYTVTYDRDESGHWLAKVRGVREAPRHGPHAGRAPDGRRPYSRPSPKPPVEDRPKQLFVPCVAALTRDPYAVWSRHIPYLRPLPPPREAVAPTRRGPATHQPSAPRPRRLPAALPRAAAHPRPAP